jgi:hypothetical protein
MMTNQATDKRREVIDADEGLTLKVTPAHVKRAKCGDPGQCVVAQALRDHFGPMVDGFQVGSNITKVYSGDRIIRYSTPGKLARSLRLFDRTRQWHLPPGEYTLKPLAVSYRRGARWEKMRRTGTRPQDKFRGTPMAPTRRALTVRQLRAD